MQGWINAATGVLGLSFECKALINVMEFELTEEQQQMKMSVREFAESEIAPHVMEWDEAQHFPIELRPKLRRIGVARRAFSGRIRRRGAGIR